MSDALERARALEIACDFGGASRAALEAGDARWAARLAALANDEPAFEGAKTVLGKDGEGALVLVAEDLLARGLGVHAGGLFEAAARFDRAGDAFAAGGDATRAALAYERAGRPADAARTLERALREDPSREACRLALAELLARHGRVEPCVKVIQAMGRESPERQLALPLLARSLRALGLSEAAREVDLEIGAAGDGGDPAPAPATTTTTTATTASVPAAPPSAEGQVLFGRFEVVRSVAKAAQARVFEAIDRLGGVSGGQRVAVKVVALSGLGDGRDALLRFEREARALAKLRHANVVPLVAYLPDGPAMVLEWMSGGSLADLMRGSPFAPARAAEVAVAVLGALGEAHRLGILHRDVKPSNVLFDAIGAPRLSDFGAAHLGDLSTTVTAGMIGTFAYMSPEQRKGRPATVESDLYAVGALLYEMLTGEAAEPVVDGHFSQGAPSEAHADLGPTHDALVAQLLAEDPAARPRDAFAARRSVEGLAWSSRVLPRSGPASVRTRSDRPPATHERLAPARSTGDGRDAERLRFDTVTERHVVVVPLDEAGLGIARGFALAGHPALPLVLRASAEEGVLWIEAPRGQCLMDLDVTLDANAAEVLAAALAAAHAAGAAHGRVDREHVYLNADEVILAWPRFVEIPSDVDAHRRFAADLEALARLA